MSSKPFDATLKDLIEADARAWAALAGARDVRAVALVDADVSTVTASADKVLRVEGRQGAWLLNLEPATRHAGDAPGRMHLYSALLQHRHGLPVTSVLLLLRREANAASLTGEYTVQAPEDAAPYLVFRYQVVRVWQEPLAPLLQAGLAVLPLAALTDEAEADLAGVVRRIDERLRREAEAEVAAKLRTAVFVLLGVRYDAEVIERVYQGVENMEDSTTYQLILSRGEARGEARGRVEGRAEGRAEEARRFLLRQGRAKFGEPDAATAASLEGIGDVERLEALGERLLRVESWQQLLAEG